MKGHLKIWIAVLCIAAFSSCRVQRDVPLRYHTMVQRATATVTLDEHRYSMGCGIRMWRNELIVVSVQPMLGIEIGRIEMTQDSVWVFDKMNHRYAVFSYRDAQHRIVPLPNYKMIQDFVTDTSVSKESGKRVKTFSVGEHRLSIECSFSNREYDTLDVPKRLDTNKYTRVSLHAILPI